MTMAAYRFRAAIRQPFPVSPPGWCACGAPVDLGYYPADAPLIDEIRRAARGRAKVVLRPQEIPAAPWLDLDPSWVEPDGT